MIPVLRILANICYFFLIIAILVGVKWHLIVGFFLSLFYFIYLFLAVPPGLRFLVPRPGVEPAASAVKAPNHWTAGEFPFNCNFNLHFPNE